MKTTIAAMLSIGISFSLMACQTNPEAAGIRETMDQATRQIRVDHLKWAGMLVTDPTTGKNHADEIQPLSPNAYKQIQALHQEYQDFVDENRKANPKE